MLIISQAPGIRHNPFSQDLTLAVGGTGDRTSSTECQYCGLETPTWERHVSHGSLPRRGDISADPKGQAGLKREKRTEMGVPGRERSLGPGATSGPSFQKCEWFI